MKIRHNAVAGPIFERLRTLEFDVVLGPETWPARIELFRDLQESDRFRCRIWQLEPHRIQSSFPEDGFQGNAVNDPSDRGLLVELPHPLGSRLENFEAESSEAALQQAVEEFVSYLKDKTRARREA